MFETLETAPADPILGLTEAFKQDPNPAKINLGVGVYKDGQGNTPVFDSVREAIEVGERAGVPVDIIHLKIADQVFWGRMNEVIDLIESARKRGVNVQANVYPYTAGNNNLVSIIPPWAHEGGRTALLARLKDPQQRERIKHDIQNGVEGWYNHYTAVGGDFIVGGPTGKRSGWWRTRCRTRSDRGRASHRLRRSERPRG